MPQVTFLHTSDLQLGMVRWFLDADAQTRYEDARLRSIRKLGEAAVEHGCSFIVMAGDVFEHNSLEPRTLGRALDALAQLPVPTYLMSGNHDPLVADSVFARAEHLAGITVITDSEPISVGDGVWLVGAPLLAKTATTDLVRQALEPLAPSDEIRIAVGHGSFDARGSAASDVIDVGYVDQRLADGTIDYLAMGDTHSTGSVGSSGRIWYSGSPETTDFHDLTPGTTGGEVDSGNALVVTIRKDAEATASARSTVTVERVVLGEWTFEALHHDMNTAADVDDFLERLRAYLRKETTVVKYALVGTLAAGPYRRLEQELAHLRPRFGALYERERLMDLHLDPTADEIAELDLSGYAASALDELLGCDDEASRQAIKLLFRLTRQG